MSAELDAWMRGEWTKHVVICAGNRYVAHTNAHSNGTHVITIKREQP